MEIWFKVLEITWNPIGQHVCDPSFECSRFTLSHELIWHFLLLDFNDLWPFLASPAVSVSDPLRSRPARGSAASPTWRWNLSGKGTRPRTKETSCRSCPSPPCTPPSSPWGWACPGEPPSLLQAREGFTLEKKKRLYDSFCREQIQLL